jgi:hypothetical protein
MRPHQHRDQHARDPTAQRPPTIACEDVPLDEARQMGRGLRMNLPLYQQPRTTLLSRLDRTVRITIPDGTHPTTMKNRILRRAAEFGIPVTIRRMSGGLLFWRSTDEDLQQAIEAAQHAQTTRMKSRTRRGRRRDV